jgi:hypothetical protein
MEKYMGMGVPTPAGPYPPIDAGRFSSMIEYHEEIRNYDTFKLLAEAQKHGARVALFGRSRTQNIRSRFFTLCAGS